MQIELDSDPERIVSRALTNDTLARLLDQSLDCIKLIGLNGAVRYMNSNGLCAMEIDDTSAVIGRVWHELWPAESKPLILDAMAQAAAGKPVRFDAFCPTAKGSPRWWDVSVAIIRDDDDHVLWIPRDVARRQRGAAGAGGR